MDAHGIINLTFGIASPLNSLLVKTYIGCVFAAASPLTSSLARSEVKEEGPSYTDQIVNFILN